MLTRGIKDQVDIFIRDLQAQFLQYGADPNFKVQLQVRPIQFWEIVFPENNLATMIKTFGGLPPSSKNDWKQKYFSLLRKTLKAKPIPKIDLTNASSLLVQRNCVGIELIGIREDQKWKAGDKGMEGFENICTGYERI